MILSEAKYVSHVILHVLRALERQLIVQPAKAKWVFRSLLLQVSASLNVTLQLLNKLA